jgi:alpha-L-rhamnosidase
MNSGNHVMLVGDLGIWLYEYLAGIRPTRSSPLQAHHPRPEIVPGLDHARAVHRSPYGPIRSEWKREGDAFHWNVSVPPNTTATVCLPADDSASARESGRSLEGRPGLRVTELDRGRLVLKLAPGNYRFHSRLARTPGA